MNVKYCLTSFFVCIATVFGAFSLQAATTASKSISLGNFTEIEADNCINVVYSQGALSKGVLTAPADMMKYIQVEVKEGTLECKISKAYFKGKSAGKGISFNPDEKTKAVTLKVSSPYVSEIEVNTSAVVRVVTPLSAKGELKLSGTTSGLIDLGKVNAKSIDIEMGTSALLKASNVVVDEAEFDVTTSAIAKITSLKAESVKADASTSGIINISGKTSRLKADASTSGSIQAGRLEAERANVSASTSGSVKYNAPSGATKTSTDVTGGSISNVRR